MTARVSAGREGADVGRTQREGGANRPTLSCPSCRTATGRLLATECVGRLTFTDVDGEERTVLLVDAAELSLCCAHCGEAWWGTADAWPALGRVRVTASDDLPEGVELFDTREMLHSHLGDRATEEIDLDYEMVMVDATVTARRVDGWVELVVDPTTVDETLDAG